MGRRILRHQLARIGNVAAAIDPEVAIEDLTTDASPARQSDAFFLSPSRNFLTLPAGAPRRLGRWLKTSLTI